MISPLRYSGGKSRLYKKIKEYFPKNKVVMVDVFFGGGSIGLNWLNDSPNNKLVANDIDNNLINFWNKVKYIDKDKWLIVSKLTTDLEQTKHHFEYSKLSNAMDFLIRNKCSFNGIGKFSEQAFNQNFNISTFDRINKCHDLLKNAELHNLDYKYLLLNTPSYWNGFYYLDPPYLINNAKRLYKHGNFNHQELAEILIKIDTYWVLSINDCEEIRELYKGFNIYEIDAVYSSSNNKGNKSKRVKELVITNFNKES